MAAPRGLKVPRPAGYRAYDHRVPKDPGKKETEMPSRIKKELLTPEEARERHRARARRWQAANRERRAAYAKAYSARKRAERASEPGKGALNGSGRAQTPTAAGPSTTRKRPQIIRSAPVA